MKKRILGLMTALCVTAAPLTPLTPTAQADDADPTYLVTVTQDAAEYTAQVTLENIAASYGTFGLKYDTSLFDFSPDDVIIPEGLMIKYTPEELTGAEWSEQNGYYVFVWQAGGYDATVLDATESAQDIATLKFTLKSNADPNDMTLESITVMPWHKTNAAIEFAKELPPDDPLLNPDTYYSEYWRWMDKENDPDTLARGRLEKDKATIHGINKRGFYQAAVDGELDDPTGVYFYDVKTVIDYKDIDIKKSVIKLHTIDKDTGEDIESAAVELYKDIYPVSEKLTDDLGEATWAADITGGEKYSYTVTKEGYFPIPLSGFSEDRPTFTTAAGKSTEVTVELKKKIYHIPKIAAKDEEQQAKTDKVSIGGESYGYNGQDFHFRIVPKPGYRITEYPTTATVSVGDEQNIVLTPPDKETQTFTLSGDKLYQDPIYDTPDEIGWRSDDIIITFDKFDIEEVGYEVTALTNQGGTVAYNHEADELAATAETETDQHKKLIKTTADNRETGTFTFQANSGNKIEKVYINGLQIHSYEDTEGFDYTFGKVDTDNNITVLFYDGENPSKDTVMTLVVGDYGYAAVSSPAEDPPPMLRDTRRTYLNPTERLEFTAVGMDGYELNSITLSENGSAGVAQTIYPEDATHPYQFEPPDEGGSKTVFVTFKDKNADDTPTIFVKAYVRSGRGTIAPCGILIYNYYDTPAFSLTAQDGEWFAKGVYISPFADLENGKEYNYTDKQKTKTYAMQPLTADTAIGASFAEKGYTLIGYVDLGQGSAISGDILTGATVTFTRENGDPPPIANEYRAQTTANRNNALFRTELPKGSWTVTVTKQGYVKYVITNFDFDPANETDETVFGGGKKITPYIGSTRTGTSVSFIDAAAVKAEMLRGEKNIGDVDDDGLVTATDMAYVLFNYGKRTVEEEYGTFLTSASPEKM